MRQIGICGARRGKGFKATTRHDDRQERPADLVARQFKASAPNRLCVADPTYVKTHTGWVYVAFIIDVYSRTVVGWQASRSLRSDLAIDALRWPSSTGKEPGRPVTARASQPPRRAISQRALLRAAGRQRHRRVGRLQG
jgi:putative transposase